MFKKILLIITMLYAAAAFAAVDVNKATEAELDGIKGIGPGLSSKILDERKNGNFKDWNDLIARVSGVGEKTAAKFSSEGLTVNGKKFNATATAKSDGKTVKGGEKAEKNAEKKTTSDKADKATAPAKPVAQAPAVAPAATSTATDSATKK